MGDPVNHTISPELEDVIDALLWENGPTKATILELGSGEGTGRLCERFNVISIEHDEKFLGWYESTYIHAPIEPFKSELFPKDTGWYSREVLHRELPKHRYDLILVDGPPNAIGRGGFYKWRELFNLDVPIVVDDIHRARERRLIELLSQDLRRPFMVYPWGDRHFGVIV